MAILRDIIGAVERLNNRKAVAASCILVAAATFASFSSILDNSFLNWDDVTYLNNPNVRRLSLAGVWEIFTTFHETYYSQPLVLLTMAVENHLFGRVPLPLHATSIFFHTINSILVMVLAERLGAKRLAALSASLLFALHPLHVESVAWVVQLKDVLSTFFFLVSLILYLRYSKFGGTWIYLLSLFAFLPGLLSKTMVVTLPVVLILCDYLNGRRLGGRSLLDKIPFFALSAFFSAITLSIHGTGAEEATDYLTTLSLFERFILGCDNLVFYLEKLILPIRLSSLYPYPDSVSVTDPRYALSLLIVLGLTAFIVYAVVKRWRTISFALLFFIVTISPTIKLVYFPSGGALVADRYAYLPSIGIFFLAAVALSRVHTLLLQRYGEEAKAAVPAAVAILAIVLAVMTFERGNVWQNSETLWTDVLEKHPASYVAHYNLANYYMEKGRLDDAITHFEETIKHNFEFAEGHNNLGNAYAQKRRLNEAQREFKIAATLDKGYREAHVNLGNIYLIMGYTDLAIDEYRVALKISAAPHGVRYNLAMAYLRKGQSAKAAQELEILLKNRPNDAEARRLLNTIKAR